jgi:scyllo-inositol 2-dehydrogenase (NAD+)
MKTKLNIGVIGLGRMGHVYAADLAQRVPHARLAAVADQRADLAEAFALEYGVPKWHCSHQELIANSEIDAVAVMTPTSTHAEVVMEAARGRKAIFCEKPISLTLEEAARVMETVTAAGVFFQMGFQRRFDAAYRGALQKVKQGAIGDPILLRSTSRDAFRPPLEFCDPKSSGGLIGDMGVHDFDVARMFMGDVRSVYATGGVLAYPEMKSIGDIDNAVINMVFERGTLGVVELSRNAVFGYDIRAEIWGTKGTIQVGYFRETQIRVMTEQGITHDVVPHFMQRFETAYLAQIEDFVENVLHDRQPSVTGEDAVAALRISLAANRSLRENRPVEVQEVKLAAGGASSG